MKQIDICTNCYAHLMGNTVYLYVDNEFTEMLYIDEIESIEDPIPLIVREVELSSRPSLYSCMEL
ncbi:hypothetical protein N9A28_08135 [Sulfurimonas sp.]|nr:hypothetical protein [Sulfurimonas sp.]